MSSRSSIRGSGVTHFDPRGSRDNEITLIIVRRTSSHAAELD